MTLMQACLLVVHRLKCRRSFQELKFGFYPHIQQDVRVSYVMCREITIPLAWDFGGIITFVITTKQKKMSKEESFAAIQGSWETRDGGDPVMTIVINGTDAVIDGTERGIGWNEGEDVWAVLGGNPTWLIPNQNGTLTTVTPATPFTLASSFIYGRVE